MIGISTAVPTSQLALTKEDPFCLLLTIMNKKHGAFVTVSQCKDDSEIFIGKQCRLPEELDREGWARLTNDKSWCLEFLRQNNDGYPPFVARAVAEIDSARVNL